MFDRQLRANIKSQAGELHSMKEGKRYYEKLNEGCDFINSAHQCKARYISKLHFI